MKLRKISGHEMITVATDGNVITPNQWTDLMFRWSPDNRKLSIYVDGTEVKSGVAQAQSGNMDLGDSDGEWTWGKEESSNQGNLDADVRDFSFCRTDGEKI